MVKKMTGYEINIRSSGALEIEEFKQRLAANDPKGEKEDNKKKNQ